MFENPYQKMVCDSDYGDGGVYFYNEYLEWIERYNSKGFKVYFKDIKDVQIIYGGKKKVIIYLNNGEKKNLYLYRADTLKALIHQAIERVNGKEEPKKLEPEVKEEVKEDDITKLERLVKLHDSGALTDEEFNQAKKKILG